MSVFTDGPQLFASNAAALGAVASGPMIAGQRAYVATFGAFFSLEPTDTQAPDNATVIAATGGGNWVRGQTAIALAAIAQGTWIIDPVSGSDEGTGLTNLTALKTFAEYVRRCGTSSPRLRQNTTITFISSQAGNTDPVEWSPFIENGAIVSIQGSAPTTTAAVFTLVAAKNRAAGVNSLLTGSFSAGAPAVGVMVQNTTAGKSSRAFVYKSAGGANWSLTQPFVPQAIPTTTANAPTEVDTWASADTVNLLSLVSVNIATLMPTLVDSSGTGNNFFYVYQLNVLDPAGVGLDPLNVSGPVEFIECSVQRTMNFISMGATQALVGSPAQCNDFWLGGFFSFGGNLLFTGVALAGGGTSNFTSVLNCAVGFDYVAGGFGFNLTGNCQLGNAYQDCTMRVGPGANVAAGGGSILYGGVGKTINVQAQGRLTTGGSSFTATFTTPFAIATGIQLDGTSLGNSIAYAANVGTIHNGIATTVANLDAAAGAAGFGGLAFNPGGAALATV